MRDFIHISEKSLQASVVKYLRAAMPHDAMCLTIPGGDRGQTRAPGYVSGTPDLLIIYRGKAHFIELKTATGRISPEQKELASRVAVCGSPTLFCRNLDDVSLALVAWGIPTKGRLT